MTEITKAYRVDTEVRFEYDPEKVNLTHYDDSGTLIPRMTGIYPDIVTEDQLLEHLAFNAIVNGVSDASSLDGYAELERGQLTMRILHGSTDIEAA